MECIKIKKYVSKAIVVLNEKAKEFINWWKQEPIISSIYLQDKMYIIILFLYIKRIY